LLDEAGRIGGKGGAVLLAAEQIKPLAADHPEPGIAGIGHATGRFDGVVAAELGTVDFRMGDKGRAVAVIAEAPNRPLRGRLKIRQAPDRPCDDTKGAGAEALDGA